MNKFLFTAYPFYRLLLFLICGVVARILTSVFDILIFWIITSVLTLCLFIPLLLYRKSFKYRWVKGVIITVVIFLCGFLLKDFYYVNEDVFENENTFTCEVDDIIKTDKNRQTLDLECWKQDSLKNQHFKVIAYNDTTKSNCTLHPGDQIYLKTVIRKFKTTNPYVFDYGKYLKNRDIVGNVNLTKGNICFISNRFSLQYFFTRLREAANIKLHQLNLEEDKLGLLTALVLGDKSNLDSQIQFEFSNAGVMHVLAVSGLHVGIIFLIVSISFQWLDKFRLKGLKLLIVLFFLWIYAFMTGVTPSILRATIMFSIFVLSGYLNQSYQVYHSMAISAFIILVIDPDSIINAGFWLSFLAVASIVYFYPRIFGWIYFSKPWNKYLWSLVSVSLAVQIGTAPLVIYLFGFFPSWFLLSNILIIPLIPFVFGSALIILAIPENTFVFKILEGIVHDGLTYCELCIKCISNLPYAHFLKVQISGVELIFFYFALVCFLLWSLFKNYRLLFLSIFSSVVFLTINTSKSIAISNKQAFIVYDNTRHSLISRIEGGEKCLIYTDQLSDSQYRFLIQPLLSHYEIQNQESTDMGGIKICGFSFSEKYILLINDNFNMNDLMPVLDKTDIVVFTKAVSQQNRISVVRKYPSKKFVFDSSITKYQCDRIKNDLSFQQSDMHFVTLDGAYLYEDRKRNLLPFFKFGVGR